VEERLFRHYIKEEEFLDSYGYGGIVTAAEDALNHEWQPKYDTDDETRRTIKYFLSTGELNTLVFDSASIFHNKDGFSSVQITLKSSHRNVTVRVRKDKDKYIADVHENKLTGKE